MKKATIFIMAVLLVAQFNSMQKINYLENDLQAARREIASVDNKIEDIRFDGEACAISTAATSIMIRNLIGKTLEEVKKYDVYDAEEDAHSLIEHIEVDAKAED